jgi:formate/nitrite transporter
MQPSAPNGTGSLEFQIDALLPAEMAVKAQAIGVKKAQIGFYSLFMLAVLAGAFIALGAIFSTTATAGSAGALPYGATRVIGGLVFSLGLILVVVGGAELFTGNNLIVMAWASGKVSTGQILRNWAIVYAGNLAGSLLTAIVMFLTKQYMFGAGAVGLNALTIAKAKTDLEPVQAVALGILCNALVCLAVWLCFSARSTTDKILAILFPITAFVAAGFEHSIANMYYIPIGPYARSERQGT